MSFTHRGSWKATLSRQGKVIEIVPVTWTKGWQRNPDTKENNLEVWFQDPAELAARAANPEPFVIALGVAHDYGQMPHSFKTLQGVFEVVATGEILSENSLQTRVLRRLQGS